MPFFLSHKLATFCESVSIIAELRLMDSATSIPQRAVSASTKKKKKLHNSQSNDLLFYSRCYIYIDFYPSFLRGSISLDLLLHILVFATKEAF